ncbi:MAG: 5'-methylthioadenosine/adenosylhomocysteine nucleosidase [Clostridia bacterium]|nr:5'-methylthioadenosine/adenosylhomocysteine nucleosidase [Clostridia bacterium]
MIGIIGAMEIETRTICSMLEDERVERISGRDYHVGRLFGREVVVCTCGIGKVFAAICTEAMIINYKVELVINTGVAGALSDKLDVCDVVVSTAVVQHDMDTSPLGDPVGLISGINRVYFDAHAESADKLAGITASLGINTLRGVVASGDQFIAGADAKERIKANFPDAVCAEMEGGAIGHCAYVNDTPFVVLRAISDKADGTGSMDYMKFCSIAAENSVKVLCEFIRQM